MSAGRSWFGRCSGKDVPVRGEGAANAGDDNPEVYWPDGLECGNRNGAVRPPSGSETLLDEGTYQRFRELLAANAGISLSESKRQMVVSRLLKRLQGTGVRDFAEYYQLVARDPVEQQRAIDLLSTNETHFFREPQHFERLRSEVLPTLKPGQRWRFWSAASSSGEEAYSIAMLLHDHRPRDAWEVLGSDVSTRMVEQARSGVYGMHRLEEIPKPYLHRYCLKGTGAFNGQFCIDPALRQRTRFEQINLVHPLPAHGPFNVIFLRNILIYFKRETRRAVLDRIKQRLVTGGWLFVGHSEALDEENRRDLEQIAPSVYRKR